MLPRLLVPLAALVLGGVALVVPGTANEPAGEGGAAPAVSRTEPATRTPTRSDAEPDDVTSVLAISVDGLNPAALRRLGPEGAPHLHAFRDAGASTLEARTEHEATITLPNHTGMVTGRRVDAAAGGHGVTWNDDRRRPSTVQAAAGQGVESLFSVVSDADGSTALFASKTKFSLWKRSWPGDIDKTVIELDNPTLVRSLLRDLRSGHREVRFLHLSWTDSVGHDRGFMSRPYLRAVRRVDGLVGQVVNAVTSDPHLLESTAIVLTSDHGGLGREHADPTRPANYRVPFMVRGPDVEPGSDLYDLNPDYRDPGRGRPSYGAARPPVRNGDLANLALDLLDLGPVPGSEHDADQSLDVG